MKLLKNRLHVGDKRRNILAISIVFHVKKTLQAYRLPTLINPTDPARE